MNQGGPQPISVALAELIARRGWARATADDDLSRVWAEVAGERVAKRTRVGRIKRRVLHVAVESSALLGELAGFRKDDLLARLNERRPELGLEDLKFRLGS